MNPQLEKAAIEALAEEGAEFVSKKLETDLDVDDLTYLEGRLGDEVSWTFTALGLDFELIHRHSSCFFVLFHRPRGLRGRCVRKLADLPSLETA